MRATTRAAARTTKDEQLAADDWNARHAPIGTPVRYWPGPKQGPGKMSTTRGPAAMLGGAVAVVWVNGHAGCLALDHVEALP